MKADSFTEKGRLRNDYSTDGKDVVILHRQTNDKATRQASQVWHSVLWLCRKTFSPLGSAFFDILDRFVFSHI